MDDQNAHFGDFMWQAADEAAGVLKALANPSRLLILCQLAETERTVGEIEKLLGLGQAYVSQQLARLREEGLVAATRDGRQMRYRLSDPRITPLIQVLYSEFCAR
ncbi:ArsR/SmtB family transcription factor [Ovoidimarina sediminis]|uniref:ArsR/SmtB family transcription factor n=1 Tax=Ovoidimarina sediminis TaxID=3079856 RepID=UPI0029068080|nr:metalloregulator ArsR/SmtB family transcription factor [Rhodophyticola sp. MJ-SS7]MDU8946560.1 metalloregulator ArsR/SmtB family transcription factor [Rhodophyticola sp. MJ-SS7]